MAPETQKRNPYVGPRPFERRDRDLFFGRDRELSEILSLVTAHRALLLYAQSGAGKTSLLNAGLIPLLEEEGFEVLPLARVRGLIPKDMEPEEIPNLYVFNTLMSWVEAKADTRQLAQMSFADFLKQREHPIDEEGLPSPRAVIFDQFEELFALYQERWRDREGFFKQVRNALEGDPLLRAVFVIREDYIAQLDSYAPLLPEKLPIRFRLERLREGPALSAVKEPLRDTRRSFAKCVAEQLVKELLKVRVQAATGETVVVTGEFIEPVQLQVVCQSLWQDLPSEVTVITRDHLRAFGDVNQALSGFYERCIERAAQEPGVEEGDLRVWFEDILITPAGTRGTVYRGRDETGGIPNAAVDVLEDLHFIRGEWRAGARWYELTHDRFIEPVQESNKMQLTKRWEAEQTLMSLEKKAQEWQRQGRSSSLLLSGEELLKAENLLTYLDATDLGYGEALLALVQTSRTAQGEIDRTQLLTDLGAPPPRLLVVDDESAYDVFISYSSKDRTWVRGELLSRLEAAGLKVCIDFRDFEPGVPSATEMERAVLTSRKTLLILTPAYLEIAWTEFETLMLQVLDPANRGHRLIPLLKEKCEFPLRIRYLTYVDFAEPEDWDISWTQLLIALGAPPVQEAPEEPTRAEWCLKHPYPMPPNFTGRVAEREMLSQWLNEDSDHPLLVLRALGGLGKSALAWHWVLHDVDPARWPRVVWWSFYDEPNFDRFLQETLTYLGVDPRNLGPRPQADALLRLLRQPGILLLLDGFERALRAYSGMGAAYQGDHPFPQAGRGSGEGQRQRDCMSIFADHFLRGVASLPGMRGKVLMTTRLRPRALETHGDLLWGCREEELTQMQPADAVAFFRAQGVRGSRAEIERACEPYGYHPLSLRLLAGLVARDLQQPGDIAAARRLDVSGGLVQRRHHVLTEAYDNLSPRQQKLLSRMAAFRGPVYYSALSVLVQKGEERDLDADLQDLVVRGLLQHDRQANRYTLHPIVRRYPYNQLDDAERRALHSRLRDYFAAVPTPERVRSLEDLAPIIELYHHTVSAGQYDEAWTLFRDRLWQTLYYRFGAYQLQIELLRAIFPNGEEKPPLLTREADQALALNQLANAYSISGQPRRAIPLFERLTAILERVGDKRNLAVSLENLATGQMPLGALWAAEANLRRSIALRREIMDEDAIGHQELGRLLAYRGLWAEAEQELATALTLFETRSQIQSQTGVWAYRALSALLLARVNSSPSSEERLAAEDVDPIASAIAAARRALELTDEWARAGYPIARDYVRSHWLLGAALLADGDIEEADRHLSEALTRCRSINLVELEAAILVDLARLRTTTWPSGSTPDVVEALHLAQEALIITERSGYALQEADVHLFLAEMALEAGDEQEALMRAQEARRLAACDGPPDYIYKVTYEEAGALLVRLGAET